MPAHKPKKSAHSLVVRGRNATGKIIEGVIPTGELPTEDPSLAIQRILAKYVSITPTPVHPE
jgi:hypothetical protein